MNAMTSPRPDALGWLQRRAGVRFQSLSGAQEELERRSANVTEEVVDNRSISLVAHPEPQSRDDMNMLLVRAGDHLPTGMSFHAFGQLAGLAKAPAAYLRSLPAMLVKDNLEFGLSYIREAEQVKMYGDAVETRAFTGPGYGRVLDFEVVEATRNILDEGRWQLAEDHMGLQVSDRSLNIFMLDKTSPVVVGRARDGRDDVLFRGLRISNSEVGGGALTAEAFLFRDYCKNGMIFRMRDAEKISIRHTKGAPARWAREVQPAIEAYAAQDGMKLLTAANRAKDAVIAHDDDSAMAWLVNRGLTRTDAKLAMERVQLEEGNNLRTVWDAVQGITAVARDIVHVEERSEMERVAGNLWMKAA
jgi:hypothetical protein